MNFSKWTNIIKVILLKVVDELERRINENNNGEPSDHFSTSLYASLKFIILEQVDHLVDEAIAYTKKQINDLSNLIAEKTAIILASVVYILLLIGMILLVFILFIIALSLYLGLLLGNYYIGFLITGGITLVVTWLLYRYGYHSISSAIRKKLLNAVQ